jgi:hypothetical protein
MTTYHRYLIYDGQTTTIYELEKCLCAIDPSYRIDGEAVMLGESDRGIGIDVTHRGNPVFDGDFDLVCRHAMHLHDGDGTVHRLQTATCMVTAQVFCNADERALDCIWSWLRTNKQGVLIYEGGVFDHATVGSSSHFLEQSLLNRAFPWLTAKLFRKSPSD